MIEVLFGESEAGAMKVAKKHTLPSTYVFFSISVGTGKGNGVCHITKRPSLFGLGTEEHSHQIAKEHSSGDATSGSSNTAITISIKPIFL